MLGPATFFALEGESSANAARWGAESVRFENTIDVVGPAPIEPEIAGADRNEDRAERLPQTAGTTGPAELRVFILGLSGVPW